MSLWYAQNNRRVKETGKFRRQTPFGTQKTPGGRHRGWSYHFVSHRAGTSVQRTTYSVSILDPHQNRVAYLRDFSSVDQAASAARQWIDHTLSKVWSPSLASDVGTIPQLPTQEK